MSTPNLLARESEHTTRWLERSAEEAAYAAEHERWLSDWDPDGSKRSALDAAAASRGEVASWRGFASDHAEYQRGLYAKFAPTSPSGVLL